MPREYQTTRCHTFDHREFIVEIADERIPEPVIRHFIDGLERMVAAGNQFSPGDSFQVGWTIVEVAAAPSGALTLHEPDHEATPLTFRPGVTRTLFDQMVQLFVLDSYGIDRRSVRFPSMLQSVVVCGRFQDAQAMFFEREVPDGHSSGWHFTCTDDEHDHGGEEVERISLYEASMRSRRIVEWVALPPQTRVLIPAGEMPRVLLGDEERTPAEGSFVAKKYSR